MTAQHLLIVEDSKLVASAFRALFEESGYSVETAGSGRAAIASATQTLPDVMLLDLTLPDCDGLEVLRELQSIGIAPRATVAITGHDDDAVRARCLAAGCSAVRVKPVPIRELVALVRSL